MSISIAFGREMDSYEFEQRYVVDGALRVRIRLYFTLRHERRTEEIDRIEQARKILDRHQIPYDDVPRIFFGRIPGVCNVDLTDQTPENAIRLLRHYGFEIKEKRIA